MTLVLLPLKYEIDDSVTVTVVLLGGGGALLYAYVRDIGLQVSNYSKIQVYGISAHSLHFSISFLVVLFDEYSRNIFHYYTLSCILIRYVRLHAPRASS